MTTDSPLATLDYEQEQHADPSPSLRIAAITLLIYGGATFISSGFRLITDYLRISQLNWGMLIGQFFGAVAAVLFCLGGWSLLRRRSASVMLLRLASLVGVIQVALGLLSTAFILTSSGMIAALGAGSIPFHAANSLSYAVANMAVAIGIYRMAGTRMVRGYLGS